MKIEDAPKNWVFGWPILKALQQRPMYLGTANENKVAKRRAKNKVAKISRRKNRLDKN